jgi:predicted N-acyltransferase
MCLTLLTDDKKLSDTNARPFSWHIFERVAEWSAADHIFCHQYSQNVYLQADFLTALEQTPAEGITPLYAFLRNDSEQTIGFVAAQIKYFEAAKSWRFDTATTLPTRIVQYFKKTIAQTVRFQTLTIGNLLSTGENGCCFHPTLEAKGDVAALLLEAIERLRQYANAQGKTIESVFVKDFFPENPLCQTLEQAHYHRFAGEPNMILDLCPHWRTFEDYLDDLSSKYRIRIKRAFKKANSLHCRTFSLSDIIEHQDTLYQLYQSVAAKADFNLVQLHERYFEQLQRSLGKDFQLLAYFDAQQTLVGFFTLIRNDTVLEAHFLGYDHATNTEHQLYLNMLIEMTRIAIAERADRLIFARTATEIKSSIGAQAHDMRLFVRYENYFWHRVMPFLMSLMAKREVWVARHPFK